MMEIVLLGHRKQVGKDMLAQMLCERDGFVRIAYADKLKEIVSDLFRFDNDQMNGSTKEMIDLRYGYSPRYILQTVGTEYFRSLYPNIWIDYVLKSKIPSLVESGFNKFVITDLRFPNEHKQMAEYFSGSASVKAIRIDRPSLAELTGDEHPSETALMDYLGWDNILINSGTPEDLYNQFKRRIFSFDSNNIPI